MAEASSFLLILGRRIKKAYVELLALVVAGVVYGLSREHFDNVWYAVAITVVVMIAVKVVIERLARKEDAANK